MWLCFDAARGQSAQESRDGEMQLPKTYLTKKGAIVLFAAPENPADVEPSERDRLFMKRVNNRDTDSVECDAGHKDY